MRTTQVVTIVGGLFVTALAYRFIGALAATGAALVTALISYYYWTLPKE